MVASGDTVDEATKQESRFLASYESSVHKIVRIVSGIFLVALAVFLVGECIKLPDQLGTRTVTKSHPDTDPKRKVNWIGTAKINTCDHNGWLRSYLFGESWDCSGEVTWNNGPKQHEHFHTKNWSRNGDDTGKTFNAIKAIATSRSGNPTHTDVIKNDRISTESTGWGIPTMVISGIVTFLVTGVGLGRLIPYRSRLEIYDNERKKLRDRLIREGRIQPWDLPSWNRQETSPGG